MNNMKNTISIVLLAALMSVFPLSAQIDRTKAPEPGPAPVVEFGNFEKFTLDNGLRVILVEDHERPIVSFGIRFIVDPFVEGDKAGESSFFGQLWSKGTASRTAEQINNEVDFLGASFATGSSYIGFTSLSKYTDKMMDILSDVLYNPTFPQEELDKIKNQAIGGLKMSKTDPASIISNIQTATVYPKNHPYGDIMTDATVNAVTVDDCREYYDKYIIPNSAILVITGDMTLDQAKAICGQYLANWEEGEIITFDDPDVNRPEGIEVVFSPKDGAVQSTIRMMAPIELKPGAEDVLALSVANGIYGGGDFAAKLMKNLRETKGYTYGAYSSVGSDPISASFYALADVNGNATDSSFVEMRKELQSMMDGDYTEADVKKFKTLYAGSFSRSLESSDNIAQYAYMIERYGFPEDYYATYLQRLDAVTMEDVQRVIAKYFDPDNMYWFCVGDPSVIPALAQYDSDGTVVELDFEGNPIEHKEIAADVTVQTVFDNYINYLGGRELIDGIKDMTTQTDMTVQGMTMSNTVKIIPAEKAFSQTQSMGGQEMSKIKLVKGKLTVSSPMGGSQEVTDPAQIAAVVSESDLCPFPEVLGTDGYELTGIETMDGRDAYKVKSTSDNGTVTVDYYDVETGAKVKTVESAMGQSAETYYVEYQKTKYGIMYPSVMKMVIPQLGEVEANVVNVKINSKLKAKKL